MILTVSLESPSIPFKLCNLFCTTDNHFKFTQDFNPYKYNMKIKNNNKEKSILFLQA